MKKLVLTLMLSALCLLSACSSTVLAPASASTRQSPCATLSNVVECADDATTRYFVTLDFSRVSIYLENGPGNKTGDVQTNYFFQAPFVNKTLTTSDVLLVDFGTFGISTAVTYSWRFNGPGIFFNNNLVQVYIKPISLELSKARYDALALGAEIRASFVVDAVSFELWRISSNWLNNNTPRILSYHVPFEKTTTSDGTVPPELGNSDGYDKPDKASFDFLAYILNVFKNPTGLADYVVIGITVLAALLVLGLVLRVLAFVFPKK